VHARSAAASDGRRSSRVTVLRQRAWSALSISAGGACLLDLGGAPQQRFEVAILGQCAAVLGPDLQQPRGRGRGSRQTLALDHFVGGTPNRFDDLGKRCSDDLWVVHTDTIAARGCIRSLSEATMVNGRAAARARERKSRSDRPGIVASISMLGRSKALPARISGNCGSKCRGVRPGACNPDRAGSEGFSGL